MRNFLAHLFGRKAHEPYQAIKAHQFAAKLDPDTPLPERIMAAYNLRGLAGYTADECAHELGLGILTVRPRITELFQAGKLRRTGSKRANYSGLKAHVFVSTRIPHARSGVPITAR